MTTDKLKNILVVEDNSSNQALMQTMLSIMGFQSTIVDTGQSALEALKLAHYDLILTDCLMPVMDGYELTKRIRATDDENANIPIIALTANALNGHKQQCLDAGMNDYLPKPIIMEKLSQVIDQWANAQ